VAIAELKSSLAAFAAFARALPGDEKSEAQSFLDHFFRAFGHPSAIAAGATFEFRIAKKPGSSQLELLKGETSFSGAKTAPAPSVSSSSYERNHRTSTRTRMHSERARRRSCRRRFSRPRRGACALWMRPVVSLVPRSTTGYLLSALRAAGISTG
jgi:hypothetical protein